MEMILNDSRLETTHSGWIIVFSDTPYEGLQDELIRGFPLPDNDKWEYVRRLGYRVDRPSGAFVFRTKYVRDGSYGLFHGGDIRVDSVITMFWDSYMWTIKGSIVYDFTELLTLIVRGQIDVPDDHTDLYHDFVRWYHPDTGQSLVVARHATHESVLNATGGFGPRFEDALEQGWVSLALSGRRTRDGVEPAGKIRAQTVEQALAAARWMRGENQEEWYELAIEWFDPSHGERLIAGDHIALYLENG